MGIPFTSVPGIVRAHGGILIINPLARFGGSAIWRAVKRARSHGLVDVKRERVNRAIVTERHEGA